MRIARRPWNTSPVSTWSAMRRPKKGNINTHRKRNQKTKTMCLGVILSWKPHAFFIGVLACSIAHNQAMFMPEEAADRIAYNMRKSLQHYAWLRSHSGDTVRFPIRPKFHWCYHIAQFARFQNPRTQWTYKNEDWVGRIATMAHSISHGTKPTKVAKGLHAKYRVMLHLRLLQALSD